MIIIESGLLEEVRVSAAIEHFKRRNHDKPFHKVLKVLKPDVIINLVEDGQQKKYTFVIENFAGNLFRRLEQCQDSVILGIFFVILKLNKLKFFVRKNNFR